jgi:hypothetical protein
MDTYVSWVSPGFTDGTYQAYMFLDTCANNGGTSRFNGGDGVTSDDVHEVHAEVACTDGTCFGVATNDFGIPNDLSVSIVVHDGDASGSKMLCADLPDPISAAAAASTARRSRRAKGGRSGSLAYLPSFGEGTEITSSSVSTSGKSGTASPHSEPKAAKAPKECVT